MLKILDQEIDLAYYTKVGIIKEHFPLHDPSRKDIETCWENYRTRLFFGFITGNYIKAMQPLNFIANYYGEKMAFYFAWLMFYTAWLLIPAIPGILLFAYQMVDMFVLTEEGQPRSVDNLYNPFFAIIMAFWSTIFVEAWKRKQSEIAHLWDMDGLIR